MDSEHLVSDAVVRSFAELSTDRNPIHLDDDFAAKSAFGRRIAHGMISAAYISAALAKLCPGAVYLGQTLKFLAPVFVGDTVVVRLQVLEIRADKPIAKVRTQVLVRSTADSASGAPERAVVDGEAIAKLPTPNNS